MASLRAIALVSMAAAAVALGGCTVRPLYSEGAASAARPGAPALLSSIAIKPVTTRPAQQVRNHLIFLFNGGAGQPAAAQYDMTLVVTQYSEAAATIQRSTRAGAREPTASTLLMTGTYTLTEAKTGVQVATGTRSMSASYDQPGQEFAVLRAERDAEDRAARELAELLRLAIAQDLSRG